MDTFRQSSEFLDPISIVLFLVSNIFFCLTILKHWKPRILKTLVLVIYPVLCTSIIIFIAKIANEPSAYIVLFICSMVLLISLLKATLEESIFLTVFQLFHIISTKSLVAGAMSLILRKNMYQLFQVSQYAQLIMCISNGLLVFIFCSYYLSFNKQKIEAFFLCKGQVYYVMFVHIILCIYMLFKSYNFYFNLDLIWFSVEQICTSVALYALFMITLKFSVRIANLNQNELRLKNQNFKILSQMANFQALPDSLKEENQISKDNVLNAFFYEFKNMCKFENIDFKMEGEIPSNLNLEGNELHEILSCALKNALESNLKVSDEKSRKINIKFETEDKYLKIEIENPFIKKPKLNNGVLETSKKFTELEGMGIGYIKQTLEENKGKIKLNIDNNKKIFKLTLLIKLKK